MLQKTNDIIIKFETFAGDSTELSTQEELDLVQKIYNQILAATEWEFLKKTITGSISGSTIPLPSDFSNFSKNYQEQKVIFVTTPGATSPSPWYIIPFNKKSEYRNASGYAYLDMSNQQIVFTGPPTSGSSYEFDEIYVPPILDIVSSNPVFPIRFYDIIYHGMLVDNDIIQIMDKARGYQEQNQTRYNQLLSDMQYWNSTISNIDSY